MAICKGCGRWLKWIHAGNGKWIACDSESIYGPTSGGSVVLPSGEIVAASEIKRPRKGYRQHWISCDARKRFKPTTQGGSYGIEKSSGERSGEDEDPPQRTTPAE